MLLNIKQMYGAKLSALDGEIGHVSDFYFDDQHWAVRYVVADTGFWLSGHLVLISPHAFRKFDQDCHRLFVSLNKAQIENSPPIESHKPISRQYEEEHYCYYGWPPYWQAGEMWGHGGFPLDPPPHIQPSEKSAQSGVLHHGCEAHLRSTKALRGYHIETSDGEIGHVTDFMVDDEKWAICQLVVQTGHWYSSKEIIISPRNITRVSYEESMVFVNVTKDDILNAAEYHLPCA